MKHGLADLSLRMETLSIFRGLLDDPVISRLKALLWYADRGDDQQKLLSLYGDFVSSLYERNPDFSRYLSSVLFCDDNFYVRLRAGDKNISPAVETCLTEELALMGELCAITSDDIRKAMNYHSFLPTWDHSPCEDFIYAYNQRMEKIKETGYGIFAKSYTFTVEEEGLVPTKYTDGQVLEELYFYKREKDLLFKNTEALLAGNKAENVLLYGDAGTGKSSTVKALVNKYGPCGLRLVEIKKHQLFDLAKISQALADNPLKFILFIDDLSFSQNDDGFSALKALLEGSVSMFSKNTAIYATSNRRQLLKELPSSREGDDIHLYDTLQETGSLSARFGLVITFQQPDKTTYLKIVDALAKDKGLGYMLDEGPVQKEFHRKAEAHAIRSAGRTPRTARQFISLQKIGIDL